VPPSALSYVSVGGLIALLVAHTVFAGQVHAFTSDLSRQLFAPEPYISKVIDTPGKMSKPKDAPESYAGDQVEGDTGEPAEAEGY
jgi:multicomponent K+:H+ antiporter subunit D